MKITVPHRTTKSKARRLVEKRMADAQSQFGHYVQSANYEWNGDVLAFEFKAKGFTGKGTLEVTDTEVIIDGKLPLLARPFESRIKSTVEREAESMFRTA
jgi:hypothetical protein